MSPFGVKEKKGSEMEFGDELWRLSLGKAMEGSEHLTYLLLLKIADEWTCEQLEKGFGNRTE
jgi:hypothetical protein